MYRKPLVPEDFQIPEILDTPRLRLRPLTIGDAVRDFDAVVTSEHHLRTVYDPGAYWPKGLTLEQNVIEMGWHQHEFQMRTSLAYTVAALNESRTLGCMYIYPSRNPDYDVWIPMWVRESEVETGLDEHLFNTVQAWIDRDWPFERPAYPGRTISWDDFRKGSE